MKKLIMSLLICTSILQGDSGTTIKSDEVLESSSKDSSTTLLLDHLSKKITTCLGKHCEANPDSEECKKLTQLAVASARKAHPVKDIKEFYDFSINKGSNWEPFLNYVEYMYNTVVTCKHKENEHLADIWYWMYFSCPYLLAHAKNQFMLPLCFEAAISGMKFQETVQSHKSDYVE